MSKILFADIAAAKEVHVETQGNFIGAILIGEDFVVGEVHGKSEPQVIVKNPLGDKTYRIS